MSQWLSQTRKMNNHYQSGSEGFKTQAQNLLYNTYWFFTDSDGVVWNVPPVVAPNDYELLLDTDADGNAINRGNWFPQEKNRRHFKIYRPVGTISLSGKSFGRYFSKYDNKYIYYGIICCDNNPIQFGQTLKTNDNYLWHMSYSGAISGWGETLKEAKNDSAKFNQKAYAYENIMSNGTIKGNAMVPYVRRFAWYFVYSEDDGEIPEWCKENCEEIEFAYITKGQYYDCFLPDIEGFNNIPFAGIRQGLEGCNVRELQEYGCLREILYNIPEESFKYLMSGIRGFGNYQSMIDYAVQLEFENYDPPMGNSVFTPWYSLSITDIGDKDDNWYYGGRTFGSNISAFADDNINCFNYGCLRNPITKSNEINIKAPQYGYRQDTTIQNMRVTSDATREDINATTFKYCDAGCPLYIYTDGEQRFITPNALHGTGNAMGTAANPYEYQKIGLGSMISSDSYTSIQLPPNIDAYNLPHGRFFLTIDNHIDKVRLVKDFTFVERINNEQS